MSVINLKFVEQETSLATIEEAAKHLVALDEVKEEMFIKVEDIEATKSGTLIIHNCPVLNTNEDAAIQGLLDEADVKRPKEELQSVEINPTDSLHYDIAKLTGIGGHYYFKMLEALRHPESDGKINTIFYDNVNYWLSKLDGKKSMLLRLYNDPKAERPVGRSLLSRYYRIVEDYDMLELLLNEAEKQGKNIDFHNGYWSDSKFSVEFRFPDVYRDIDELLAKYKPNGNNKDSNNGIHGGFKIINSEGGKSSYQVIPMLITGKCSNGMIFQHYAKELGLKGIHRGSEANSFKEMLMDSKKLLEKVQYALMNVVKGTTFENLLDICKAAAKKKIQYKEPAIARMSRSYGFGQEVGAQVFQNYMEHGDTSLLGLSQAITWESQKQKQPIHREKMEVAATEILMTGKFDFKRRFDYKKANNERLPDLTDILKNVGLN